MKGFTLIEILVALAVFAVLSTLTALSMSHAFNTRARVSEQMERIAALDLGIALLNRDTFQITSRGLRDEAMRLRPAFIGHRLEMEFTTSGFTNPHAVEKRSTLKRISLFCHKDQLVRRSYASLDRVNENDYEDRVLFSSLQSCQFEYLSPENQWNNQWINIITADNKPTGTLPKAIQVKLVLKDQSPFALVFVIPEGLYESIRK